MINTTQKYRFRQKDYAQEIFTKGFQNERAYGYELKLLALYLRDECGLKPQEREAYIWRFMKKYASNYHERRYYRIVSAALKYAEKKDKVLVQIPELPINQEDIEFVERTWIPYDYKKVLFTIIMAKKLDAMCYEQRHSGENYRRGFLASSDEKMRFIKASSCTPAKLSVSKDVMKELVDKGMVTIGATGYILSFIDKVPLNGEKVMSVTDFDHFGLYWDLLFQGDKMGVCEACGVPIRKTRKDNRYCKEHLDFYSKVSQQPVATKKCTECGHGFFVDARAHGVRLCPTCRRK